MEKAQFIIEITETLQKRITVEAGSSGEAEAIVKNQYQNCEIVLNADNCIDSKITCISGEDITEKNQGKLFE